MLKPIIFQGMCYSGKSTLGKMTADALGLNFLDSRDLFFKVFGRSEINYLKEEGRESFVEAEKQSLRTNFDGVFSCGGSAVYFDEEMKLLKEKYNVVWLDVDYDVILNRRKNENKERPIVFPDGINSFEELYQQRRELYPLYATHIIKVQDNESIETTLEKILTSLKNENGIF